MPGPWPASGTQTCSGMVPVSSPTWSMRSAAAGTELMDRVCPVERRPAQVKMLSHSWTVCGRKTTLRLRVSPIEAKGFSE